MLRLAMGGVFAAAAAAMLAHLQGAVVDDALITYRYASNLDAGHGWAYNPGAHTANAATSPLYTAVLAAVSLAAGGVARGANLLFIASVAASATLLMELAGRAGQWLTGVAAGVLAVTSPWLMLTRGLETPMFLALSLAAVYTFVLRRDLLTGVLLGALVLTRGDGAVLAAVLVVAAALRGRSVPWRMLAGVALVGVPWLVVAPLLIGGLLPDTLGAKAAQGASGFWGTGLLYVQGPQVIAHAFRIETWVEICAALAALGACRVLLSPRLFGVLWPLLVSAGLLFVAYGFVIRPPVYHWYYGPQLLGALVLGGAAVGWLLDRGWQAPRPLNLAGAAAGGAALVAAATVGFNQTVQGFGPHDYITASAWLRSSTPPAARVAATEIGILGWLGDRAMVDYLGLLSTQSVAELRRGDIVSWLAREQPDYWLVHTPVWPLEAASSQPWFNVAYQPVWTAEGLVAYRRVMPIADAQRLTAVRLRPQVEQLLRGQSHGGPVTAASGDALVAVLGVYARRPDLQASFSSGGTVDLPALLAWAAGPGSTVDIAAPGLSPHSPAYAALRAQLTAPTRLSPSLLATVAGTGTGDAQSRTPAGSPAG
ncbi:MAG TPA: hypothetical protein VGP96_15810 [Candidatus Dormibacteraeota bacterium]|nr:hypothetical protein [Candidatus Dormibacteraeota bacterium]